MECAASASLMPSGLPLHRPGIHMNWIGRGFFSLLVVSLLAGCGPVYTYLNNDDKFERHLALPMSREEVQDELGTPALSLQREEGRLLIWEYRLYPRYHWAQELAACPFTIWLGGCLFYPAIGVSDPLYPEAHYVVLYDDQLCTWGTLDMVSASTTCRVTPPKPGADEPSSLLSSHSLPKS